MEEDAADVALGWHVAQVDFVDAAPPDLEKFVLAGVLQMFKVGPTEDHAALGEVVDAPDVFDAGEKAAAAVGMMKQVHLVEEPERIGRGGVPDFFEQLGG